jgi:hypothetical protein
MASDSPSEAPAARVPGLADALDAVEACLDALEPGADPDRVAESLSGPVRALSAAAKQAIR